LKSGVDILSTNTYHPKFEKFDDFFSEEKYKENDWVVENINVANEAIDEFMATKSPGAPRPLLALTIGPFASVLGVLGGRATTANRELTDAAEDRFKCEGYGFKAADIRAFYNARLADDILCQAANRGVSVIAIETVGDLLEVKVICDFLKEKGDLLAERGLDTWVVLTCDNADSVDTGGSVTACMEVLARCQQVTGVGVNCTAPQLISPIVAKINKVRKNCSGREKLIVVYPNSGETYLSRDLKNDETHHWQKNSTYKDWNFADAAMKWIDSGVNIVGGCCRITAEDIAELVEKLEKF
jgi:homocysteine S-methyltransferase